MRKFKVFTMETMNSKKTLMVCLISAMGGLLFGYDWVVIGGAKIFYEPFFQIEQDAAMRGWAMSSALLGCLFGAGMSGRWCDLYGRKKILVASALLFLVSAIGTGAVDSFFWFIIYRIIGGVGIGMASNVSPIYIAEVAPAHLRGQFVSINQLTIVLGILMAQLANWWIGSIYSDGSAVLSDESVNMAWRWMFWAEAAPAFLFFVLSFVIPESPRWLYARNNADGSSVSEKMEWSALFRPGMRKVLCIGIVLAVFQQWCGINVIFNYAHEIFSAAGYQVSDVLMNIVITGVTNVVFTFVAIRTVDRWGRRRLMLFGSVGLMAIYLVLGGCYYIQAGGWAMLLLVVLAIACYAMSLAPVVWVVLSEIFPQKVRGTAMALSTLFLWIACFVLTYTFPILNDWLQAAGTFWLYGIICLLGAVFIYRFLPETKGKTLEEIENELTNN